jgi:hypothetical protein
MKNAVFADMKTQFVPHRKHYVSTTELSRLLLCKICGFQGSDYEKCRLLRCYAAQLLKEPKRISSLIRVIRTSELEQS